MLESTSRSCPSTSKLTTASMHYETDFRSASMAVMERC